MALQHIPPIQCLLTFEALARLRNAGRAANELCVTPSAVSHRIRQLESHLGFKLFGRSDFTLTADGAAYLANVRAGLAAFGQIVSVPEVRLVLAMSIGIFFINHGLNNWLPELLRSRGMSAAAAGYWASIPTVVGVVGSLIIPRLATPARRLRVMALLFMCSLVASLLLPLSPGPGLAPGPILPGIAPTYVRR